MCSEYIVVSRGCSCGPDTSSDGTRGCVDIKEIVIRNGTLWTIVRGCIGWQPGSLATRNHDWHLCVIGSK